MYHKATSSHTISTISVTLLLLITAATSAKPTMATFIPLHKPTFSSSDKSSSSKNSALSYSSSTTEYAAAAMNSVAFMKELIAEKNTDDVKYYRHPPIDRHNTAKEENDDEEKKEDENDLNFQEVTIDDDIQIKTQSPRSYETVCEYTGKLWFLPGGGVRFRETLWMEQDIEHNKRASQAADENDDNSNSLIVHCDAEYYDGKSWVECSRVTCKFVDALSSTNVDACRTDNKDSCLKNNDGDEERYGVDMTLESELLVRLPLPGPAARAFQRLIASTFQKAALSLFDDLMIQQQKA